MEQLKFRKRFWIFVFLLFLYSYVVCPLIKAEELVISDNGPGSTSEINLQSETQTTVEQINTASTYNLVTTETTSGENSASDNTGGNTNIQTGDVSTETYLDNQINSSLVQDSSCCQSPEDVTISQNGTESDNTISLDQSNTSIASINQTVKITNTIQGYVNTGGNTTDDNTGGSVSISSGDVKVFTNIVNGPLNITSVKIPSGINGVISKVYGNGSGSFNTITAGISNDPKVFIRNSSEIENFVVWDLNTGRNEASGNSGGDVTIKTGDIDLATFIKNFANISGVLVSCCQLAEPPNHVGGPSGDGENPSQSLSSSDNFGGSLIPAGAEAGAGGPGLLGLSDTSGGELESTLFILGLAMLAIGMKLIGESFLKVTYLDE